ncbi:MAG: ABC transporter permease [Erysipelothrix sp.]|nr:ABC transporter permease [Erysipelothrix sp.]
MSKILKKDRKQYEVRDKVQQIERQFEVLRTVLAIAIAMVIVLVIIAFVSSEPLTAIRTLLIGPLTNMRQLGNVITLMIPLTFTGLALTVVFKSKRFNLASDSAFYLGSLIAAYVGIFSTLPPLVTIIIALVGGAVGGFILGWIPAILNRKFGAGELVTSLMLNYITGFFVLYVFNNVIRNPQQNSLMSYPLPEGVNLGNFFNLGITKVHWGLLIALIVVLIAYLVVYKTKWGYALRTTGLNEKFAHYTGLNTAKIVLLAQVIGTGIAGLGGAVEMLGNHKTFRWTASPGYGFDGVIIATLARNNPVFIPVAAFFLAYIRIGADMVNFASDVPAEIISVVQATIILLIAAQSFLGKWKQRRIVQATMETQIEEA